MRDMDFRYQLASYFVCRSCSAKEQTVEIIALTGERTRKLSKFDQFDMISSACKNCGKIEFFDKYFLPENDIKENFNKT